MKNGLVDPFQFIELLYRSSSQIQLEEQDRITEEKLRQQRILLQRKERLADQVLEGIKRYKNLSTIEALNYWEENCNHIFLSVRK